VTLRKYALHGDCISNGVRCQTRQELLSLPPISDRSRNSDRKASLFCCRSNVRATQRTLAAAGVPLDVRSRSRFSLASWFYRGLAVEER
jgi:hypothetical protein